MAVAVGQITLTDFNDAVSLTGFRASNKKRTILFNPDASTFTPDWSESSLVLDAKVFKPAMGGPEEVTDTLSKNIVWQRRVNGGSWVAVAVGDGETLSLTKNKRLTVDQNRLAGDNHSIEYRATAEYTDPKTNLTVEHVMEIEFSKVSSGSAVVTALCSSPNGNTFHNEYPASLEAKVQLYRGSLLDTDLVEYSWSKLNVGTGLWEAIAGQTDSTLTITRDMVDGYAVFRGEVYDNDPSSSTYEDTITDTVAFVDMMDPLQLEIVSSNGQVFKNGVGSTDLTARLFRHGKEIDVGGTEYSYAWSIKHQSETSPSSFGTGKTVNVGTEDVNVNTTFFCEATKN